MRTELLRVRVTPGEKIRIWHEAKDAGLTPSDYMRGLILNTKPVRKLPTPGRELLLKLLAEQNKAGSNLNQIARELNRKHSDHSEVPAMQRDLSFALAGYGDITTKLMEILTNGT